MICLSRITVFMTVVLVFWSGEIYSVEETKPCPVVFSYEGYAFGTIQLPYRQAVITQGQPPSSLVIYLHGGTGKGSDNISHMKEPGIDAIACFLSENHSNAVFVAPQCPDDESWAGIMLDVLEKFIFDCQKRFSDVEDIYILGGSMGGTGTWTMVSKYPGLFSAAMPVAGNPSRCDAQNVASTPLLTVMGTDDKVIGLDAVIGFTSQLEQFGAEYVCEIEDGWSHEDTCIRSYTPDRLAWVFSHSRQYGGSCVVEAFDETPAVVETIYSTLSGLHVSQPSYGYYIRQQVCSDGSVKTCKLYVSP